jgi:hypothetical protein
MNHYYVENNENQDDSLLIRPKMNMPENNKSFLLVFISMKGIGISLLDKREISRVDSIGAATNRRIVTEHLTLIKMISDFLLAVFS